MNSAKVPGIDRKCLSDAFNRDVCGALARVSAAADGTVWGIDGDGRVIVVHQGEDLPTGPEVPPTDPSAVLMPRAQPDGAQVSALAPGSEPEAQIDDDLVKQQIFEAMHSGDKASLFKKFNADPEPRSTNGGKLDPDDMDPGSEDSKPSAMPTVDETDPASAVSQFDNSNPM